MQLLIAPVALLVDAATFVWSAVWIGAVRTREPAPRARGTGIRGGLRFVFGDPVLRTLTIYNGWTVLFMSMGNALHVIFLLRVVGLDAAAIGVATVTLRQRVCPDRMLGRMNATMRFAVWGPVPFGALLGGAAGTVLGVRGAVWLGAGTAALSLAVLVRPSLVAAVSRAEVTAGAGAT